MQEQHILDFESEALARRSDPETSHEAAKSVNATDKEQLVLDALRKFGRGSSVDVAEWTGESLVTVSPRFKPLALKGFIRDSGQRKPNPSGRNAIVWEAV